MNGGLVQAEACDTVRQSTVSDRLEAEENILRERLAKIERLRASLKAQPEIQGILDALAELGQYRY